MEPQTADRSEAHTEYNPSAGARPLKTSIPSSRSSSSERERLAGKHGHSARRPQTINVSEGERTTSLASGAILTILGLSRRSLPGLLIAAAGGALAYRGSTGHCSLYQALGIDTTPTRARGKRSAADTAVELSQTFSINVPPKQVYAFWRKLENLPQALKHIESIQVLDDRRSHWVAKPLVSLPARIEWDAEITRDEPNEAIAWRSLPSSDVETNGEVTFRKALGDRGTAVRVTMSYRRPGGKATNALAGLFGKAPDRFLREDLRRVKRLLETGEIPTIEGQTRGTCADRAARGNGHDKENR